MVAQIHDGQNANSPGPDRVEHAVSKLQAQATSHMATNDRPSLWILEDGIRAMSHVGDKRRAESWLFPIVVLRRIVELTLSQFVKRNDHSRKTR
jgi:hypothetical protein